MRLQDVTAALKAFKAAKEQDTVAEEEFQRRLSICQRGNRGSQCPQMKRGVRTIRTRISEVLAIYSNRHGVRDEITKFSCGVCGCSFGLLLPAKPENLHKDSPEQDQVRPGYCWMKEKNLNKPVD